MADHWTADGNSVSEATVRRWAAKHLAQGDVAVADGRSRLKTLERAAKDADKRAETIARNAAKAVAAAERDMERRIAEIEARPRTATPRELADAEKALQQAKQKTNKYQQIAAALAREDNILDAFKEQMEGCLDGVQLPTVATPYKPSRKADDPTTLLLCLNDIHFGDVVTPESVGGMNAFSPNIACRRLERVVDVTRTWIENYRSMGEVDELVVLMNGDNINNAIGLHPDEATDYARVGKQVLDAALVYSQVLIDLAQAAPRVRVVATAMANHSRMTHKSPTSSVGRQTSFEVIMHEFIAALVAHVPHIEFEMGESYVSIFGIKGHTFAAAHGQFTKGGGVSGVPINGLKKLHDANVVRSITKARQQDWSQVKTAEDALEILSSVVSYTLIGHYHQSASIQSNGSVAKITPSLKGPDTYSLDVLARYNPAEQALFAVNESHGIIGDHTINCQSIMDEGESRYVYGALEGTDTAVSIFQNWMGK